MKKTALAAALLVATSAQASTFDFAGTFWMWDGTGAQVGMTDTTVTGTFNFDMATGTGAGGNMTSTQPFFGINWTASDITMAANMDGSVDADMTFTWGVTVIPVSLTLSMTPNMDGTVAVASLDGDGDGIPSTAMTTGPFSGFSPEFAGTATCVADCGAPAEIPVPAAVWLFGSGLVGLAAVARRRKAA